MLQAPSLPTCRLSPLGVRNQRHVIRHTRPLNLDVGHGRLYRVTSSSPLGLLLLPRHTSLRSPPRRADSRRIGGCQDFQGNRYNDRRQRNYYRPCVLHMIPLYRIEEIVHHTLSIAPSALQPQLRVHFTREARNLVIGKYSRPLNHRLPRFSVGDLCLEDIIRGSGDIVLFPASFAYQTHPHAQ